MSQEAIVFGLIVAGLAIAVALALGASRARTRRGHLLRQRFGPEYDRALETYGSAPRAQRALEARARRVRRFKLKGLSDAERARFTAQWTEIQARFVDEPLRAVREANELIKAIMTAVGYPDADFDQRVEDLSVDHPGVVQHYRAAHALTDEGAKGRNTEDLRQAVIHFRALFADLVETVPVVATRRLQHA